MDPKYDRLHVGERVFTVKPEVEPQVREGLREGIRDANRWGVFGTVVGVVTIGYGAPRSAPLYDVRHDEGGSEGFYELTELRRANGEVHLARVGQALCGSEGAPNSASVDVSVVAGLLQGGGLQHPVTCQRCLARYSVRFVGFGGLLRSLRGASRSCWMVRFRLWCRWRLTGV